MKSKSKLFLPSLNLTGTRHITSVQTRIEFPTPQVRDSHKGLWQLTRLKPAVSDVSISPLAKRKRPTSPYSLPRTLDTCIYCGKRNSRHWGANPCKHTDACLQCMRQLSNCPKCGELISNRYRNTMAPVQQT